MSYLAQNALATMDIYFRGRVSMCVAEQAKVFVNDDRPEFKLLAEQAIMSNLAVTEQMLPLVATQPGMGSDSTDDDLLAAVQTLWPVVGARLSPPP